MFIDRVKSILGHTTFFFQIERFFIRVLVFLRMFNPDILVTMAMYSDSKITILCPAPQVPEKHLALRAVEQ